MPQATASTFARSTAPDLTGVYLDEFFPAQINAGGACAAYDATVRWRARIYTVSHAVGPTRYSVTSERNPAAVGYNGERVAASA